MSKEKEILHEVTQANYAYGFSSPNVATEVAPPGLSEATIRLISTKKNEPAWLLDYRLKAYRKWQDMQEPTWANVNYPAIDYQKICYYAAPKKRNLKSLDELDPEIIATFDKLGIPLEEQKRLAGIAVDAVWDSVSVATTFKETLKKHGILFCPLSEAIEKYPKLVQKYLGRVVPIGDNYFATLNMAVFTDGSFCYIPKGVKCPLELSTYFRINTAGTGQFERTLIIAEEGSYVSYLEGCSAPMRDEHQLHAAVVELIIMEEAEVRYATIQNWWLGNKDGIGGVYNFVTKRALCKGKKAKVSWTQVETGSKITWKYPSCVLQGDESIGEFYSVAITRAHQQADTGTKMIHLGKGTKSRIVAKGISAGKGRNTYRGLVKISKNAEDARNYSQCDSLLIGSNCEAHTFPYIEASNNTSLVEHEATTSKIGEEQLFYCNQRGIDDEKAIALIVAGYCKEPLDRLPMEFALEAKKLLSLTLEGSVG